MSYPARTLFFFGIYVLVTGVAFLAIPGVLTAALGMPQATVGWPRMIGLLALVIGTYDIAAARAESALYIRTSVWVRFGFAAGVIVLVLTGEMPMTVIPLALIDIAGAIWTWLALRSRG